MIVVELIETKFAFLSVRLHWHGCAYCSRVALQSRDAINTQTRMDNKCGRVAS